MNDVVDTSTQLVHSKLNRISVTEPMFGFLEPDITTQMQIEELFDAEYPREEGNENTRLFINFTNLNGNGTVFMIEDSERLSRNFDIDKFVSEFYASVNKDFAEEEIATDLIGPSLATALNTSIMNALDLTEDRQPEEVKEMSKVILMSLTSILLNDPKDAIVLLREQPPKEGESYGDAIITACWTIKSRD